MDIPLQGNIGAHTKKAQQYNCASDINIYFFSVGIMMFFLESLSSDFLFILT